MTRHVVASWNSSLVIALLALSAACDDKRDVSFADASTALPDAASAQDASVVPPSKMDASNPTRPWTLFDAAAGFDWEGEYCYLRVPAECDGPEDCPRSGGGAGACCARLEPDSLIYSSIQCAEQCDFRQTFPLCHAGLPCTADGNTTCRVSVLLPDDFLGVCAAPLPTLGPPTGEAVAGEIDCGAERCVVGSEQCCLRKGFDAERRQFVSHEPYCAPLGEPCDCEDESRPARDAGTYDAGAHVREDDAG